MARAKYKLRFMAIALMIAAAGDVSAALPRFKEWASEYNLSEDPRDFLRRWYAHWENALDGENFLEGYQRTGRPKHLEDSDIEAAAKAFKQGWWSHGNWKPFENVDQVRGACSGGMHGTFRPTLARPAPAHSQALH
ncbi:hypothetical protein ABPG75_006503 [Micractinium tetrahymenae]